MSNDNDQFVQGDIFFRKIEDFWPSAHLTGDKSKDGIVATGEKTGHKHILLGGVWEMFTNLMQGGASYGQVLFVHEDTQVRHEEHPPLDLPKGTYQIVRQQRFDYRGSYQRIVED